MTNYTRSDYPKAPTGVNRNNAKARGWGSGWPNCQPGKMETISGGDVRVTVREEIGDLVAYLLEATDDIYNIRAGVTGAYNCREIAGTNTPSNHSWGLAVDINWDKNPMGSKFISEIPPAVVKMWWDCGFYWGGWYSNRPDAMHFEMIKSPEDVPSLTAKAKAYAEGTKTPEKKPAKSKWGTYYKGKIGDRSVGQWDRGDDVKLIQRFFGLKDDGYYGPQTAQKVRDWQMSQDLKADGKIKVNDGKKHYEWAKIKSQVKGI